MKIDTTRRRLLAGMPAVAVMAPAADAELLQLGQRLMPLAAEIAAARGMPQDDDFWGKKLDDAVALLQEIIALQPTTMEGFAIQLTAVVTAHDDIFAEDNTLELPFGMAEFFKNACRYAGVPIPVPA